MAGTIALLGFAVWLVSALVLCFVGFVVVTKHPAKYDPARNAPRFTLPALALAALSIVGFVVGIIASVVWLVGALT